jgi:SNF family Na+-dependent transporter
MLILLVRGLMLEGASDGIYYYLVPNMTKLQEVGVSLQTFYYCFVSLFCLLYCCSFFQELVKQKFQYNFMMHASTWCFYDPFPCGNFFSKGVE